MQFVMLVAPIEALLVPAGHSLHEFIDAAPVSSMYFPCPQREHSPKPGSEEYLPTGQSRQSDAEDAGNSERYFPAWQDWHVDSDSEPSMALYFPLPQFLQDPSPVPMLSK